MNKTRFKWKRMAVGVGLCFTLLFSGSTIVAPHPVSAATAVMGNRIINYADNYMGVPYKWGAAVGQTRTFDCSSFTKHVFNNFGVNLPRLAGQQATKGYFVAKKNLRVGDLVFFYTPQSGPGHPAHVAIYAGNGMILHTFGTGGVRYTNMNSAYWSNHYVTARRVL